MFWVCNTTIGSNPNLLIQTLAWPVQSLGAYTQLPIHFQRVRYVFIVLKLLELTVSPDAPFDIDYPELAVEGAICIGLSIDWSDIEALHAFAVRHTHVEEHARAARFHFAQDSLRHLLGRALLRNLALRYDSGAPGQTMPCGAWGKPEPVAPPMDCNLTHSGDQIWAAIARFPHVGIDVESATAPSDYRNIAAGFHPHEVAALQAIADASTAMMRCWARKEAVSKAVGTGLGIPLCDYAVDCGTESSNWLRVPPPAYRDRDWTTIDLPVGQEYKGALAIEGRCSEVTVIRLHVRRGR